MSAALHVFPRPERALALRKAENAAMQRSMPDPSRLHQEVVQFRIILAVTYPFFLFAAVAQRLLPARRGFSGYAPARRSVFAEAKAMAVSAIPFAFMG